MEDGQNIVDQLQQKYLELTDTAQEDIETTFTTLQKLVASYSLPLWAKRL